MKYTGCLENNADPHNCFDLYSLTCIYNEKKGANIFMIVENFSEQPMFVAIDINYFCGKAR